MSADRMPRLLQCLVVIVATVYATMFFCGAGLTDLCIDRNSYIDSGHYMLTKGYMNTWRTPLYPLLIALMQQIAGTDGGLVIVILLQWAAWMLAMHLLWHSCRMLGLTAHYATAAVILMLAVPKIVFVNNIIFTESFAISGTIAFVYLTLRIIADPSAKTIALYFLLLAVMIFTKPVFIALLPISAVFWLARRPHLARLRFICSLSALAAVSLAVVCYMGLMKKHCGFFSMTFATLVNDYHTLRMRGLILPQDNTDPRSKALISGYCAADSGIYMPDKQEYYSETNHFSEKQLAEIVGNAKRNHMPEYLMAQALKFADTLDYSLLWLNYATWRPGNTVDDMHAEDIYLPIWAVLLIFAAYMVIGIRRWRRRRTFPAGMFVVAAAWGTFWFTCVWGSHDNWGRLMLAVCPCMVIMALTLLSALATRYSRIRSARAGRCS